MLNCWVNSIFHILFCTALAKVLKSLAVRPKSSVCDLRLPFFITIFLPPPLNSPWKDFPCWKFWCCYDLWAIPIHCISIVFGLRCRVPLFLTAIATLYSHSCKKCWIPPQFIKIVCNSHLTHMFNFSAQERRQIRGAGEDFTSIMRLKILFRLLT